MLQTKLAASACCPVKSSDSSVHDVKLLKRKAEGLKQASPPKNFSFLLSKQVALARCWWLCWLGKLIRDGKLLHLKSWIRNKLSFRYEGKRLDEWMAQTPDLSCMLPLSEGTIISWLTESHSCVATVHTPNAQCAESVFTEKIPGKSQAYFSHS